MSSKHNGSARPFKSRSPAASTIRERMAEENDLKHRPLLAALYQRAENLLRKRQKHPSSLAKTWRFETETQRLIHESEVHRIELEMQNAELQESRDKMEALLEKFTDFYDFAPVGYFSLNEQGVILEANLTGAAMLRIARSRLVNRRLLPFLAPAVRPGFLVYLHGIFTKPGKQIHEAMVLREDGTSFLADFHGSSAVAPGDSPKWCRVVVSDITLLKQAVEVQNRAAALAVLNEELTQEIVRRQTMEKSLKQSEQHQTRLLEQSRHMQKQLRSLSRKVLRVQEDERKRISRELHDVIAQSLTGINVRLASLKRTASLNTGHFDKDIEETQKLVESSVEIVHQFARELRPTTLDDLGLIPALHAFLKNFTTHTGVRVHLTAFAGVEALNQTRRTILYRVAQEALTNVARHAEASRVEVTIRKQADGVCMKIKDDGKSFDAERMLKKLGKKRLGLLGMSEWQKGQGGLKIIFSPPVRVTLPGESAADLLFTGNIRFRAGAFASEICSGARSIPEPKGFLSLSPRLASDACPGSIGKTDFNPAGVAAKRQPGVVTVTMCKNPPPFPLIVKTLLLCYSVFSC